MVAGTTPGPTLQPLPSTIMHHRLTIIASTILISIIIALLCWLHATLALCSYQAQSLPTAASPGRCSSCMD